MISSVNSSISALKAYKTRLEVTANNVANVNTEEFKKSRTIMKEGVNGGVQVEIDRVDTPGYRYQELRGDQVVEIESSNVDLVEELPDLMITQHAYKANLKALQTHDQMLGSLLDIIG